MLMDAFIPPFTPDQVAEMMGCEPGTIEDALRRGDLPGVKLGKGWRIPARALADALNDMAVEEAKKRRTPAVPVAVQATPTHAVRPGRRSGALPKLPTI